VSDSLRFEIFSASDSAAGGSFPDRDQLAGLAKEALAARRSLLDGTCAGNDYLGWLDLPITAEKWLPEILDLSLDLVEKVDHLVVTGIGGSYLGARALLDVFATPGHLGGKVLLDQAGNEPIGPEIHFAGEQLGSYHLTSLLKRLASKKFGVNVISKSGTTLETAVAFRLLRAQLEHQANSKADDLIIATTDPENGALRAMASDRGWRTFPIPADVGGRFSVLSPVGLLPLAAAGLNVAAILEGAWAAREQFTGDTLEEGADGEVDILLASPVLQYAALRKHFFATGKKIEVLAGFEPALAGIGDWWAQLFGESEGKGGQGLFPAKVSYTTDLHSLGQYMQDGPRHLIETFISVDRPAPGPEIPHRADDEEGLNSLAGRTLADVNRAAELGTMTAHDQGGVPVLRIILPEIDEYHLGELIYFFEASCAVSALMLGVNPFDQPGVEDYKREMRAQLEG
jgi:glucose-6-phosphate isomerase